MKKFLYFLIAFLGLSSFAFAVDANDLLPPEQAFVPQVNVTDQGISVQFKIADGYYMYQSKIVAATNPDKVLAEPKSAKAKKKKTNSSANKRFTTIPHRLTCLTNKPRRNTN